MTENFSIRIAGTKKRLDAFSKRSSVKSEEWQLGEVRAGIAELDTGKEVSHKKVSNWLRSWGTLGESKAPR